jgi:hypothetical protein
MLHLARIERLYFTTEQPQHQPRRFSTQTSKEKSVQHITWLHLSDWHQKGSDFGRTIVRDALIKDLRDRKQIAPELANVDFVVFSGDLAFSGAAAEYEAAQKELLDPVLDAVGVGRDRLIIVPETTISIVNTFPTWRRSCKRRSTQRP